MSYGQSNTGGIDQAAKPRAAHLSQATSPMNSSVGDVHELGVRLHKLADRILGNRPESVGKSNEAQAPESSMLQSFSRTQEALTSAISYVRDGVNRLEEL